MTKSKCIKDGKVERINLHPTKKQIWNGDSFRRHIRLLKARGYTLQNRSM